MKIGVYTAIYGDKDCLKSPIGFDEHSAIDYLLFTDNINNAVFPYQTQERIAMYDDVTKNARYFKILGDEILNKYDVLIWHDANIQLIHTEIENLIKKAEQSFLTTFIHPDRDCFYSEAMTCVRVGKDFSLRILRQAIVCFFNGMPAQQGMYSTGILIKNFKYKNTILFSFWWHQVNNFSRRDQLSLAYTLYKTNEDVTILEDNIFDNRYSVYHKHGYEEYRERKNMMDYNYTFLKKLSILVIQVLRKIKKVQK
ncbi:MAG TPA: glycosyltransferase domain-containing protein [Lutibacter sp.]